jgi:N6-L-threonylcarbamoyladenine synthase
MKKTFPLILAVDTSCDDTSASVVRGRVILSNVIASQTQLHKRYGGVFSNCSQTSSCGKY